MFDVQGLELANIALKVFSLALIAVLIVCGPRKMLSRKRLALFLALCMDAAAITSSLALVLCEHRPGVLMRILLYAAGVSAYLFSMLTCMVILVYILIDVGDEPIREPAVDKLVQALVALNVLNIVVMLSSPLTHAYFYVTAENSFVRQPLSMAIDVLLVLQSIVIMVVVWLSRPHFREMTVRRLFACALVIVGSSIFDSYIGASILFLPSISIVLALLCVGIQDRLEHDLALVQAEAAESRVRLLSGQIHPHFVFNSLAAIKELVLEDPHLAEVAIQDFSDYLRSHLDEMSTSRLVPFGQEMDHVYHYVSLEMADPTVPIEVTYDLKAEDFMIPPLTVQPLVENAIRHGIRTREQGGAVTVSSHREAGRIVVRVCDNGSGFSSATSRQNERREVGIENVRERIERQCGGTLDVQSGSEGTVATLTIPEEVIS